VALIGNLYYIFLPNVLKFDKRYGTIGREIPLRNGQHPGGGKAARVEGNIHGSA